MAIIRESELFGEAVAFLDNLDRLDISECAYSPKMVSIRNNMRLGQDLIQLESFVKYAQDIGCDDAAAALYTVCEANNIPDDHRRNMAFMVHEESIYEDEDIFETVHAFMENGTNVYICPISDSSPFYTRLNEALELDEDAADYEDCVHLHQYINESIFDSAKEAITAKYNSAKNFAGDTVSDVAKKFASVKKKIVEKSSEVVRSAGSAKVIAKRQLDKLQKMASSLKKKLISLKNKAKGKISGAIGSAKKSVSNVSNAVASNVRSAQQAVSSKLSGASNAVNSGINNIRNAASNGVSSLRSKLSM